LVTEVLQKQSKELWYLNQKAEKYFFSNVPNLNRMILDKMGAVPDTTVREELEKRLKSELGSKFRSYMWPHDSSDIPDSKDLKLVVLDPMRSYDTGFMKAWMEKRGPQFRTYKNTVFFAVPESSRYGQLENKVREYLSLREISHELEDDDRPGMRSRRKEIERRTNEIREDFGHNIRNLYRTVGVPKSGESGVDVEMVDLGQPTIGKEFLDSWYWKELTDGVRNKIMVNPPGANFIKSKFLHDSDSVSLEVLLDQFFKAPSLLALPTDSILAGGIAGGVRDGAFGLARRVDGTWEASSVKFKQAVMPATLQFTSDLHLVAPELAETLVQKRDQEKDGDEESDSTEPTPKPTPGGGKTPPPPTTDDGGVGIEEKSKPEKVEKVRTYGFRATNIPVGKIADLNRGVLMPLKGEVGDFSFSIEIHVESDDGIDQKVIEQQVKETLMQLGAVVEEE
jgi:hypothetical protein